MKHSILLFVFYLIFFAFSVFSQEAKKIDEFNNTSCDDLTQRVGFLFDEVKQLKGSKGYFVIYQGRLIRPLYNSENKTIYPRRNEVKAEINNIKTRIKFYSFDPNRIGFIEGGFRERFTVEFWLVPENTLPPQPSPTLKKMKYSKGWAEGSCKYI